MDLGLAGKRALISGGSEGIGLGTARILAEEGCDLILVSRSAEKLAAASSELRARWQVDVMTIPADLSRQDEIERVAGAVDALDILVNNAGAIPGGTLQAIDNARWREAWDLKVFGYVSLSRALYDTLKARRGVIINIIGSAGESLPPGYIAGATGNAGLMAFTRALGKQAPNDGMRVIGINPGPVVTPRYEKMSKDLARERLGDESRWQEMHQGLPFGRAATPEEIGAAVAFFASYRSAYTSGTVMAIDGGLDRF
jgi:NAD(P)-dependent dehydrogenase (short-subunit alcohol dehydrogenase family)